ncbi:EamA family transporter [Candidatus Saccharibacteria bacterium]|nr:EamA family transporter [Candidatus Saccharibacteria bacterium]
MPWQIIILLFVLISSNRAIQVRRIGLLKKDVSLYALVVSFTCILIVGVFTALMNWNKIEHTKAMDAWPYLLVGGLLFAILNVIILKLYRYIPASIMTFTTLLNTLSVLFFATMLGGETLTPKQIFGALILFVSVLIVGLFAKSNQKTNKNVTIGLGVALFTALLFGPAIMNEKYLISRIGFNTYVLYGWGFQALTAYIVAFALKDRKKIKEKLSRRIHINVWIVGVLLGMSGFAYVTSLSKSGSASTMALSGTAVIGVTVFLAYFILNEKEHLRPKIAGLVLSAVGLSLLLS